MTILLLKALGIFLGLWASAGIGITTYKLFENSRLYSSGVRGFLQAEWQEHGRKLYWLLFLSIWVAPFLWPKIAITDWCEKRRRAARMKELLTPVRSIYDMEDEIGVP